jgi:hypothetical protein
MTRLLHGCTVTLLSAGVLLAGCGETTPTGVCDPSDTSCNPTDTTTTTTAPLTVLDVSPSDGATGVGTGTTVTVTFNRVIAAASVTATTFGVGTASGDRSVSGTTVTFTPSADLEEGTSYDVSVDGVTDMEGVGLETAFSSSFQTVSFPVSADAGADFDVSMGDQVTLDKGSSTGTGASFTWTQLSGPSVGTLTGDSPTFTAPDQVGDLSFELEVSDGTTTEADTVRVWVLEDASQAIWVSASGSPSNPGTRAAPLSSIQDAIDAADNGGFGADVYVAAGNYDESLTLRSRVSVYGGFDPTEWTRDVAANRPVVSGDTVAVRGVEATALTVEGLEIIAADGVGVGGSSVAVLLDRGDGVVLASNVIRAGAGATGLGGTTPDRARRGSNGGDGGDAKLCVSRTSGGGRGVNYRDGGTGGLGAYSNPTAGADGESSNGGDKGGAGTSGSKNGGDGGNGKANGPVGANGAAGSAFGALGADGQYDPAAAKGDTGGRGSPGYGGGGGGGAYGLVGFCGGSGGGGGGGGEGGHGGTAGEGGGASFGVVVVGKGAVDILDNEIRTGVGGTGGSGALGGSGGYGGGGGNGGVKGCDAWIPTLCTGAGGDGGNGTTGGRGGHGGGGGGGPSIGVIEDLDAAASLSGNVFTLGGGGAGGASSGNVGPTGESTDHKKLS